MVKKIITKLGSLYLFCLGMILSNQLVWKILNSKNRFLYKSSQKKLSQLEKKLLTQLKKDGIAITSLQELFGIDQVNFLDWKEKQKESNITPNKKDFLTYYLGGSYQNKIQKFYTKDVLIDFSLRDELLSIVNGYFNMFTRLVYLEFNETKIIEEKESLKMSQNFHRDPGLHGCIKVFLYLTKVEEGGGGFTYIKDSHFLGKFGKVLRSKYFGAGGVYPSLDKINKEIPQENITEVFGDIGTVIIADTTGLHRGGISFKEKREMTTSVFYPEHDYHKSKIEWLFEDEEQISRQQSFAMNNRN
jgi:hypothetical protein